MGRVQPGVVGQLSDVKHVQVQDMSKARGGVLNFE